MEDTKLLTYDEMYEKEQAFLRDFKTLVRRHFPIYPGDISDERIRVQQHALLMRCQDKTSCYSAYIWS